MVTRKFGGYAGGRRREGGRNRERGKERSRLTSHFHSSRRPLLMLIASSSSTSTCVPCNLLHSTFFSSATSLRSAPVRTFRPHYLGRIFHKTPRRTDLRDPDDLNRIVIQLSARRLHRLHKSLHPCTTESLPCRAESIYKVATKSSTREWAK